MNKEILNNWTDEELFEYNYSILMSCGTKDVLFKYSIKQLDKIKEEFTNRAVEKCDLINDEILQGNLFKYISDESLCYFILNHNHHIFNSGFDEYNRNLSSFKNWSNEEELKRRTHYHIKNLPKYTFWTI